MKKILILGVAAVQYDAIKLLKKLGYEVHAIAKSNDGRGAEVADYFSEIDFSKIEEVKSYISKNKIDVVYSVGSDFAIPISQKISEDLNMPHFVSSETAKICNNKNLLRETLGTDFKGNIPFQILKTKNDLIKLEFPFIMKPSDSQGQRGVMLINNESEFDNHFDVAKSYSRSGLVIIERYITGPELSVNGYLYNGELVYCIASDRETWPDHIGLIHRHIVPSILQSETFDSKVFNLMDRIAKKLGINNGPIYGQFKMEGDEPFIIEVTPRLDGCHMWNVLNYSTGVNLLEITFRHLLEDKLDLSVFSFDHISPHYLEFECSVPNVDANYDDFSIKSKDSLEKFTYYEDGQLIKPVNGIYDKIAYFIRDGEVKSE